MTPKAIVTGAGGFIGSHLVRYLKSKNYHVVGIDLKHPEFSQSAADEFHIGDLRDEKISHTLLTNADELYMLAADMGGVGFINTVHADVGHNNTLINIHSLEAARRNSIPKVFFSSSACVYPEEKQDDAENPGLKESDAIPANPDTMYGWEKLFTERLCLAYAQDYGLKTRIARFHNIYGPEGTYQGGREKSPAAICRKVAEAQSGDAIEVWGDGQQTRSYCFIDDCVDGIYRLMHSDHDQPLNIGSTHLVTINELVEIAAQAAGKTIKKKYDLTKPQGVRGRNSDNTQLLAALHWEPRTPLEEGLKKTYQWIEQQLKTKT